MRAGWRRTREGDAAGEEVSGFTEVESEGVGEVAWAREVVGRAGEAAGDGEGEGAGFDRLGGVAGVLRLETARLPRVSMVKDLGSTTTVLDRETRTVSSPKSAQRLDLQRPPSSPHLFKFSEDDGTDRGIGGSGGSGEQCASSAPVLVD